MNSVTKKTMLDLAELLHVSAEKLENAFGQVGVEILGGSPDEDWGGGKNPPEDLEDQDPPTSATTARALSAVEEDDAQEVVGAVMDGEPL